VSVVGSGSGTAGGEGDGGEDVRGPHAALAVRLTQREPERSFSLGERVRFVLLAGALRVLWDEWRTAQPASNTTHCCVKAFVAIVCLR